jgi:hypothetical protein
MKVKTMRKKSDFDQYFYIVRPLLIGGALYIMILIASAAQGVPAEGQFDLLDMMPAAAVVLFGTIFWSGIRYRNSLED